MITEDYVSFEVAKLLKEKGFDTYVRSYYEKNEYKTKEEFNTNEALWNWNISGFRYSAPTLQMAMKWLREIKDVQIEISIVGMNTWESPTKWMYGFRCQTKDIIDRRNADFSSYEEACESAIRYCLENLI